MKKLFLKNVENLNFKINNFSIKEDPEYPEITINIDNYTLKFNHKISCTCSPNRKKLCKHSIYFLYYKIRNIDLIHKINYRNKICLIHLLKSFNEKITKETFENEIIFDSENNCSICLNKIKRLSISCTTCKNKFHVNCVTQSLNNNCHNCAVCRSKLDPRIN